MKTILCDCDGVLADFVGACLVDLYKISGVAMTADDITSWNMFDLMPEAHRGDVISRIGRQSWCREIPIYDGAQEFVDALTQRNEMYVVTSPWTGNWWHSERVDWLGAHLGVSAGRIIFAHNKTMIRGDALIDDRLSHIVDWSKANPDGIGVLVDRAYNQGELPTNAVRTHSFDQILSVIGGL